MSIHVIACYCRARQINFAEACRTELQCSKTVRNLPKWELPTYSLVSLIDPSKSRRCITNQSVCTEDIMLQKVLQIEESLLPANFEIPRFTNQLMHGNFNKWNHRGHTNTSGFDKNIDIALTKTENPQFKKTKNNRYTLRVFSLISRDALYIYRLQVPSWMYNSLIDEHIFRYVRMFHLIDTRMKHERHGIKHTRWAGEKWTNSICRQFWMPIEFKSLEERTQVLLQIGPSLDNYL